MTIQESGLVLLTRSRIKTTSRCPCADEAWGNGPRKGRIKDGEIFSLGPEEAASPAATAARARKRRTKGGEERREKREGREEGQEDDWKRLFRRGLALQNKAAEAAELWSRV